VVAGVLTLHDALRLVCERGRLVQQYDGCRGVMYAVRATAADVATALNRADASTLAHASMAACNGKQSCVLSGSESAVQKLISSLPRGGSIRLGVSHAFHSPLMRCIETPFRAVLNEVRFSPVKEGISFVSTVSGRAVTSAELASVDYWVDHMLLPVQYVDAVHCAWRLGGRTYLEMGPQDTLTKLAKRTLEEIVKRASTQSPDDSAFECVASLK
jgi:acyl transferase domain-containing protein